MNYIGLRRDLKPIVLAHLKEKWGHFTNGGAVDVVDSLIVLAWNSSHELCENRWGNG
jgi:hypothetical protein